METNKLGINEIKFIIIHFIIITEIIHSSFIIHYPSCASAVSVYHLAVASPNSHMSDERWVMIALNTRVPTNYKQTSDKLTAADQAPVP